MFVWLPTGLVKSEERAKRARASFWLAGGVFFNNVRPWPHFDMNCCPAKHEQLDGLTRINHYNDWINTTVLPLYVTSTFLRPHVRPVYFLLYFLSAQDLNLPVVGSQIVGLVPLKALLDSADFYIKRDQLFILQEEHKVRLVRPSTST